MPWVKGKPAFRPGPNPSFKGIERTKDPDNPALTGRPRKPIDWKLVAKLFRHGTTPEEVAAILDVSVPTLRSYSCFFPLYKKNYCEGNASLRRRQYRLAMSGNATMLIWMGKNRLGQKDNLTLAGDPLAPLVVDSNVPNLKRLTEEELLTLMRLQAKVEGVTLDVDFTELKESKMLVAVPKVNGKANGKGKK